MHVWEVVAKSTALVGLIISLCALAVSWLYSALQLRKATEMARLSLQQTQLMRTQVHAAFRPIIEVDSSEKGPHSATLVLKNAGSSAALAVIAVCRDGSPHELGNLATGGMKEFRFDYSFNLSPPPPVGLMASKGHFKRELQSVPLRLEYKSISGANCWTNIDFKLGTEGPLECSCEHGMDLPSLAV